MLYLKDNIKTLERVEGVIDIKEKEDNVELRYGGEIMYHLRADTTAYKRIKTHKGTKCSVRVKSGVERGTLYCEVCGESVMSWEKEKEDRDPQSLYNVGVVTDKKGQEHSGESQGVYIMLNLESRYGGKMKITENIKTREKDYWVVIAEKVAINQRGMVVDYGVLSGNNTHRVLVGQKTRVEMLQLLDKEGIMYDDEVIRECVAMYIEKECIEFEITTYTGGVYRGYDFRGNSERVMLGDIEIKKDNIRYIKLKRSEGNGKPRE